MPAHNTVYKKLLVLVKPLLVACLLASDFPSENPRSQTRNFPYTYTLCVIKTKLNLNCKNREYNDQKHTIFINLSYNFFNN